MAMIPFHTRCPDIAQREIRFIRTAPGSGGLPPDEYAFLEFYCDDPKCDCRRAFLQVLSRNRAGAVMASINIGWEAPEFYRNKFPYLPEAATEITAGSLDPLNQQSEHAPELLALFQECVADEAYKARLKRHYELFRKSRARPGRSAR